MYKGSQDAWSAARRAFNRAADRRFEPRYEIYLRDAHVQASEREIYEAVDRKTGFRSSREE